MAEFQDVMRQWVRARKATASSCEENVLSVYPLETYDDALIADIERNVMQWAADHPEPVYPTWGEWLEKQGVVKTVLSPRYEENGASYYTPMYEITNPIPGDIAEKLGLKPKEGTEWEN